MFFLVTPALRETGTRGSIKRDNRKRILSLLTFGQAFSVAALSEQAQLSKTTVSKIFADFYANGLICYAGKGASTNEGGKKPEMFTLNAAYRHVLVVQLAEPDSISCVIMNMACQIIASRSVTTDPLIAYSDAMAQVAALIHALLAETGLTDGQLCGVAVSCDGIVDTQHKIICRPARHCWPGNLPIGADMAKILPFPVDVSINNVCRYGGYAELLFPENRTYENIIVIWNDDYVGGCVLHNYELIQGHSGLVGEVGHMVIAPDSNIRCSCGGYGCLEPLVSQQRILQEAYRLLPSYPDSVLAAAAKPLVIGAIFDAANRNDPLACRLLDIVIGYYAVVIHNITYLYDIQKIIIQGSYAGAGAYFYNALRKRIAAYPLHAMAGDLIIAGSAYADKMNRTIGAGFHVITRYFNNGLFDEMPYNGEKRHLAEGAL